MQPDGTVADCVYVSLSADGYVCVSRQHEDDGRQSPRSTGHGARKSGGDPSRRRTVSFRADNAAAGDRVNGNDAENSDGDDTRVVGGDRANDARRAAGNVVEAVDPDAVTSVAAGDAGPSPLPRSRSASGSGSGSSSGSSSDSGSNSGAGGAEPSRPTRKAWEVDNMQVASSTAAHVVDCVARLTYDASDDCMYRSC